MSFKFKFLFLILALFLLLIGSASATSPWNVTISATNQLEPVTFGYHPNATDGYDAGFDVFTQTPIQDKVIMSLDNIYAKSIKRDNLVWNLSIGVPSGTTTTLTWDTSNVPSDITLMLSNETVSINMKLQNSLNLTGGAHYFLIASAISDTTPPVLTFTGATPANASVLNQKYAAINVTSSETLKYAVIHLQVWNGTVWGFWDNNTFLNELVLPMNGSGTNWWINMSPPADLILRYWVNGSDLAGNYNQTEIRYLTLSGYPPQLYVKAPPKVPQNADANMTIAIYEATPSTYKVYKNGSLVQQGGYASSFPFNPKPFNVSIDTSHPGVWNYTVWANDSFNNINQTTVFIEVFPVPVTQLGLSPTQLVVDLYPGEFYNETKTVVVGGGFARMLYLAYPFNLSTWVSVDPFEYWNVTGPTTLTFNVSISPPPGTPPGVYNFSIWAEAVDENWNISAVSNFQNVSVRVPESPDLVGFLHVYDEFGNETNHIKKHKAGDTWEGVTYSYPFVVLNATFEVRNLNLNATVTKTFSLEATYKDHTFSRALTQEELNDLNADGVLYMHDEAVVDVSNINLGCYSFNITVDSTNAVYETNETNNNASYMICISQPDLVPFLVLPDHMNPGTNEFTVGVVNIGDVWAKETKLRVWIDLDGTNLNIMNFNVPLLKPGQFWFTNISYYFAGGNYNITVKADADNSEAEVNELNNTVSKTVNVAYIVVNASVISEVSDAMLGDEFNVSLIFNTTHAIGNVDLYLMYDRYALISIDKSSAYANLTFSEFWYWPYKIIRIKGNNLNLNGTFNLANLTFKVITDRERVAPFNLSGKIWDPNGYLMKLNSTNTSVKIHKVTDLRPHVYGYRSLYVIGDEVEFSVNVRNLRSTWSDPYVLNVSIYNASGLQKVLLNQTMSPLWPWGWNVTHFKWNTTGMSEGTYWINVSLYNDTITDNNKVQSYPIKLKLYKLDAWYLWYPWWNILKGSTFWIGCHVNVTAPGYVNATIKVPDGLLVWNGTGWANTATKERFLWGGKWNWFGFQLKAVKPGEYGNGTSKEINITVTGRDKVDEINSTLAKPDEWIPNYKLVVYVPKIKLQSFNTTVISSTDNGSMTFKTIDVNNVSTFKQRIRLVVLAGQEGRILRGLDYLVHYPYGCVEQSTSSMLGALHTDWYYRTKGYPKVYDWGKVDKSIKAGVKKLAKGGERGQHDNGSWSMWGWNPKGDGFYTMYASYGLGRVAEDDTYGYLVKNNLTATHVYNSAINKGKFNFNDTIYWFAQTAKRNSTTGAIWWEPWQGTHWFFSGHLPVTSWIMVSHYQLVNEGVINDTAKQIANQTMANVTRYLVSVQNSDGGWNQWGDRDNPSRPSDAISTALSVWGLKLYGTPSADVNRSQIENAIEKGVAWLLNNTVSAGTGKVYWQHPLASPWWNDYGRRSEATAYALIALNESRSMNNLNFTALPSTNATMTMGVNYLVGIYRSQGSFGYTAATQAALHALTLLQVVAVESNTLSVTIDGVVTKQIEVNATSPKVVVELNASEINAVNAHGVAESSKKKIHTVNITRLSGNGTIIVSVENEQVVARNEITYGVEYAGHKILEMGSFEKSTGSNTILIKTLDSKIAQVQNSIVIAPTLPDNMVDGKSYDLSVKIDNNNDTALLSPIITVPLGSMSFDNSTSPKWYDSELGWNTFTKSNYNYDAPNNTLYFFPDQIPPNGYIEIHFNATVNAGNTTLEVRMSPMYNEEQTYVASATKYVKGYGDITINIYNATGAAIDANVIVDGGGAGKTVKVLEGKHTVRVEKTGYVPVEFDISLNAGDKKNYTVAMVKPEELSQPKVVYAGEMSIEDANAAISTLSNVTVKPSATKKAEQSFNLSVSGAGKKIIAIRLPKYERGSLWAWLNNSISIQLDGQTASPKEVTIGDEKVFLLEIDGSASVNISFKDRLLGDVYEDGKIDYKDAIAILQYAVFKNTSISKDMFMGKAVYGEVYEDGKIDYKDAIAILQYAVFKNTDLNADLWT